VLANLSKDFLSVISKYKPTAIGADIKDCLVKTASRKGMTAQRQCLSTTRYIPSKEKHSASVSTLNQRDQVLVIVGIKNRIPAIRPNHLDLVTFLMIKKDKTPDANAAIKDTSLPINSDIPNTLYNPATNRNSTGA
jgi:hypothetical protein